MPDRPDRTSVWEAHAAPASLPTLTRDLETEVAIVGGGITGVTLAALLGEAGVPFVLLEAREIGARVTGHSTGHLTELIDGRYRSVRADFGEQAARTVRMAARAAIERVEGLGREHGVDCAYRRVPAYLYTEDDRDLKRLGEEREAAQQAGVAAEHAAEVPLPFPTRGGIRVGNQAQFDPLAYVRGLARSLPGEGRALFEGVRVQEVEHGGPCRVRTEAGYTVTARTVVLATHVPVGFNVLQTEAAPYRSYVLGLTLRGAYPDGLFFDTAEPYHYLRTYEADGERVLLVGGGDHKTGQLETGRDPYADLERYARERFDVAGVRYRYSAEVYEPADGLPYIGPSPLQEHLLVATGYSGDGLLWGTAAALILADLAQGRDHPWAGPFSPSRVKPVAAGPDFLKENLNVGVRFLADRFHTDADLGDLKAGEGGIVRLENGHLAAAHRAEDGRLHLLDPVCPHMKCIVQWNRPDRTWDCPCHGARYAPTGEVLSGPAMHGLGPAEKA